MAITTVLFDLDGTLLPMDQDLFIKSYFQKLAEKMIHYGYAPEKLIQTVWSGTKAMVANDGRKTNEEVFWDSFCSIFGEAARKDIPCFDEFYAQEFQNIQSFCGFTPQAAQTVQWLKKKGIRVALATNPVFPAVATQSRIRWAGLQTENFELYTTYENSRYCKPNLSYYSDILSQLKVGAEECLMVGNDVAEDMVAEKLGMKVFLLTPCLLNRDNVDYSAYPQGDFDDLHKYLNQNL